MYIDKFKWEFTPNSTFSGDHTYQIECISYQSPGVIYASESSVSFTVTFIDKCASPDSFVIAPMDDTRIVLG